LTLPFRTGVVTPWVGARRVTTYVALGAAVAVAAVAMGVLAASVDGISPAAALLAAPALVAFGFVVTRGPTWCLAGLMAGVVLGYAHDSVSIGGIDLRVPDAFFVALAVWALVIRSRTGQRGWIRGRRLLALWLAALGLSLYPLFVHGSVDTGAFVGWLRLVATFSLVWLVPYSMFRLRDVQFVFGFLAFVTTLELVLALGNAVAARDFTTRLSGANDPNTTGLIAAMVIVLALHGPLRVRPPLRLTMLLIGVVSLLMTRSLGSTAAAVVALGIYGVQRLTARRGRGPRQQLVVPTRLIVMLIAGLGLAMALRPGNLPTNSEFGHSTTVHRAILASAGIELFREHPLLGVGWQQSPIQVSTKRVNTALRKEFGPGVNPDFFPSEKQTTEVHNSYVQVLAEAGLVGFLLLLSVLLVMGRGIADILRTVRHNPQLHVAARAATVLLVVVLVWWNDNTLYGAQPESVLAATFLGILAATPAIGRGVETGDERVATTV
jgi:O-antigen ligase